MKGGNDMSEQKQIFNVQRIYVKESTFSTTNTPELFRQLKQSKNEMELKLENKKLMDDHYEIVLDISVVTKFNSETQAEEESQKEAKETEAFRVKVKQAGIFQLKGFTKEELEQLIGIHCPELLYPYARHAVAELTVMGSLPPITLLPMNFHSLYQQSQQQKQQQNKSEN